MMIVTQPRDADELRRQMNVYQVRPVRRARVARHR